MLWKIKIKINSFFQPVRHNFLAPIAVKILLLFSLKSKRLEQIASPVRTFRLGCGKKLQIFPIVEMTKRNTDIFKQIDYICNYILQLSK
ncbi:hypothetical protein FPG3_11445 [Flavobacterium psychrophilum FPG3]|nr:hypothetical protein FPG3_11445 [Flavobacterium psychrophilum FPG3]OXB11768.1 hypothetical protein B0A57_07155 [Flavobacterium psychrophilum DSM 3660 = ATCC 49418]